jgi:hypothetical protein
MLDDRKVQILDRSEWLKLAQDKIDARKELLELPVQEAQSKLNRVINPNLLEPDFSHGFEFNSLSLFDDRLED